MDVSAKFLQLLSKSVDKSIQSSVGSWPATFFSRWNTCSMRYSRVDLMIDDIGEAIVSFVNYCKIGENPPISELVEDLTSICSGLSSGFVARDIISGCSAELKHVAMKKDVEILLLTLGVSGYH